ncbi:hypothetical protein [Deinococcus planocerae]|uniref:hypothetical protein n=1 Tax=Deinococcus planocerae TaxID=1737569 RepID=UPI000C7F182F|nr:hypothetical protein [Deinococcus planocerae]
MTKDTSPLGKSVEEIERDSGNRDPERNSDGEGATQESGIIPPTGLSGTGGTVAGTGLSVPVIATVDRTGQADGDENT